MTIIQVSYINQDVPDTNFLFVSGNPPTMPLNYLSSSDAKNLDVLNVSKDLVELWSIVKELVEMHIGMMSGGALQTPHAGEPSIPVLRHLQVYLHLLTPCFPCAVSGDLPSNVGDTTSRP